MAVSSVKELRKNRKFSWTRIKNQLLGIVGNPFNVIVFFTLQIVSNRCRPINPNRPPLPAVCNLRGRLLQFREDTARAL